MAGQFNDRTGRERRIPRALKFAVIPVTALCVLMLPIENLGFGQTPPPAKGQNPPPAKKSAGGAPAAAPGSAPGKAAPPPAAAASAPQSAQGAIASDDDPRVKAAVARAVAWMRSRNPHNVSIGPLALMVHALAKAREKYPDLVAPSDPVLQSFVDKLRARCGTDGYKGDLSGGPDNYEAGCVAMALTAVDGQAYKNEIQVVLDFILSKQLGNGSWSYANTAQGGDTSMTQYAILGMWEAGAGAGVTVPKAKWDSAAQWLLKTQHADGGFEYHPEDKREVTHTMTVASLGSLYISQGELGIAKRRTTRGGVLQVIQDEEEKKNERHVVATKPSEFDDAIKRATEWITKNFTLDKGTGVDDHGGGRWALYYLYAFERFATLADLKTIAGVDWYAEGSKLILSKQSDQGSWHGTDGGDEAATGFAVLFLVRSTHISKKIHQRRIGRGTLVSGRGLPTNLADLEQVAGGFKAKAKVGKTGDLLQAIETGKSEELDANALGLVKQMYEKKWTAVGEEGDKLKKIYERGVKAKSSDVIKAAMKLLALTGDYRVVPLLIDGMYYEDDAEVQIEARLALCKISRKFNGFGTIYPEEATKEEWEEEIARWKEWYKQVRPESSFEDEVEIGK
jgi:hypothetical protein